MNSLLSALSTGARLIRFFLWACYDEEGGGERAQSGPSGRQTNEAFIKRQEQQMETQKYALTAATHGAVGFSEELLV